MTIWPLQPILFEVNTWVWLDELRRRYGKGMTLGDVPAEVWDGLACRGIDAVWLMGVWERSPEGIGIIMANETIVAGFRRILPDFVPEDNVGSPYCIRRYVVDSRLGGPEGLAIARRELARRGVRLILDFVPNHVAPDHSWTVDHPEYFIQGDEGDLKRDPQAFMAVGGRIFARGRDPYFPAWPDVLQLNVFSPALRLAVLETLENIAGQCDGVRCDMAMLVINDIFEKTWGHRAGVRPASEYWPDVIGSVRSGYPDFLFLAEAYWDREWDLQSQGFDFCYDKKLYDRLISGPATSVAGHLRAEAAYGDRLCRFIENHDEPRAAHAFPGLKARAAAVVMATIPGARLFHEGQFSGRTVRLPVFLARRPEEPVDDALEAFYGRLSAIIRLPCLREGDWCLCDATGWPDNRSFENLIAWFWSRGDERILVVVNYSEKAAQGRIRIPGIEPSGKMWRLTDLFTDTVYDRTDEDMSGAGLYVDLSGWGFHLFSLFHG
ncbi:MAG: hypothetical protein CSYNP_01966 [Syntrophus sp. SKADARSKE-3]|nr:hypothetical protein [Syntrophus sp. SKADARSKE-3]